MGQGHAHHHNNSRYLTISAILLTGYAIIEAVAGWYSGSLALLSDAGHMATDVFALLIAAMAQKFMHRPASKKHSFGHGRLEVLAALANGVFNLLVVIPIIIEAVERIHNPQNVNGLTVLGVSLIALVVTISCAFLLTKGEKNLNTRAALIHLLGDILGSLGALIAGFVIHFTGWVMIDPILSLFICGLIIFSTISILKDTFHILMEGVPIHLDYHEVAELMQQHPYVTGVHDLHIWSLSSGQIMLSAHIIVENTEHWEEVLESLRKSLKETYHIEHSTLQPEVKAHLSHNHCMDLSDLV